MISNRCRTSSIIRMIQPQQQNSTPRSTTGCCCFLLLLYVRACSLFCRGLRPLASWYIFLTKVPHARRLQLLSFVLPFVFCDCYYFISTAVKSSLLLFSVQITKSYACCWLFLQGLCMGRGYIFCNFAFFFFRDCSINSTAVESLMLLFPSRSQHRS